MCCSTIPSGPTELEEKLSLMMLDRFGMKSAALVRSRDALAAAIAENPFAADGEEKFVHTLFLDGPVPPEGWAKLLPIIAGRSGWHWVTGRCISIMCQAWAKASWSVPLSNGGSVAVAPHATYVP